MNRIYRDMMDRVVGDPHCWNQRVWRAVSPNGECRMCIAANTVMHMSHIDSISEGIVFNKDGEAVGKIEDVASEALGVSSHAFNISNYHGYLFGLWVQADFNKDEASIREFLVALHKEFAAGGEL